MTPHLSDEQLAEFLSGSATDQAQAHLDLCPVCQDELDLLRTSLADFNELSLEWAANRAPARIPVPSRAAIRWHRTEAWPAVAAALAAAVFFTAAHQHSKPVAAPAMAPATQLASTSVEADNSLLLAVDQEIRVGEQSPISASELGTSRQHLSPALQNRNIDN